MKNQTSIPYEVAERAMKNILREKMEEIEKQRKGQFDLYIKLSKPLLIFIMLFLRVYFYSVAPMTTVKTVMLNYKN